MTGVNVDETGENLLEASKIASEFLDASSPSTSRRGSMKRRSSILLGLNDDSDSNDVPSIASALNVSGVRKRSITPDMADISKELQRIETSTKSPASRRNSARRKTQTHEEESVGFDASHFKKRGSTYRGSFKAKGSNPYPTKRKGSFRRNDGE